jgi:hypothetical protein
MHPTRGERIKIPSREQRRKRERYRQNRMETAMTMTGKPLIESDRVEGTSVYDPDGNSIGSIKRLMIEKISGRVSYAVMTWRLSRTW